MVCLPNLNLTLRMVLVQYPTATGRNARPEIIPEFGCRPFAESRSYRDGVTKS